ncbi:hypothetical protein SAMN05421820_107215 [Pedobacter steynii]|uniref:Uncharacterized protein n=1 Tax=Pedobacter steynii TaxID=430522 RepID=A0A1H0AVA7_9SPHI|nr:hypothetical protein SAMN05421820_107215 [Pedobacter steynii]
MKRQLTIIKRVGAACAAVIFGSIFLFNLTAFSSIGTSQQEVKLTDLLSKAYVFSTLDSITNINL